VLPDLSGFIGEDIVVTVKMDGENTSLYRDYAHARSLKPLSGSDRGIVKSLHARIAHRIPEGWRVCGENLYAAHSIHYTDLPAWFMVFSIWNNHNICLSWHETVAWTELLGLQMVPTLYEGPWDEKLVKGLYRTEFKGNPCEGYVVRVAREFSCNEFSKVVGKYVRPGHVTSSQHWRHKPIVRNMLAPDKMDESISCRAN
jgi:hypothetical protein